MYIFAPLLIFGQAITDVNAVVTVPLSESENVIKLREPSSPEPFYITAEGQCGSNFITIQYGTSDRRYGYSVKKILINKKPLNDEIIKKINSTIPVRDSEHMSITRCLNRDDGVIALMSVEISEARVLLDKVKRFHVFYIGDNILKFE